MGFCKKIPVTNKPKKRQTLKIIHIRLLLDYYLYKTGWFVRPVCPLHLLLIVFGSQ